ncbi:MAG: APC family permease [Oscillospiraceae bacterium]|nr:APC family permease [Oscillospiraceae bacterium]
MNIKDILLGKALSNEQLRHEKMSRLWGLPIMSSDAISSVAYGVEEILLALVPMMGMAAAGYVKWVGSSIIFLLLLLVFSYAQIINNYPQGGGAYVVSKENFGKKVSLFTSACLIVDYIMTVAVSTSSATAAMVAAFPELAPYRVIFALVCIAVVTLINLRGTNESSKIFGVPTYLFIIGMVAMIVVGFIKVFTGSLHQIDYTITQQASIPVGDTLSNITLLLFLKAFSSGCAALTGVEAVSDAVPNFRDPSVKTAKHVLYMLGAVIVFVFGGTCFLASTLQVVPMADVTVTSQMAAAVFGSGFMFYFLQFTTALILLLAANTAYNGLPILLSILAKDRCMPRQFAQRGTKLSLSNGIMFIFIAAALLIIGFGADTHALIPFYAVGVLASFTISQAGMFVKWIKTHMKGWQSKCIINGFGAFVTLIATFVVFTMKFLSGAWVLILIIPLIIFFMSSTRKHYDKFQKANSIEGVAYHNKKCSNDKLPCIVLIHNMSKAALKTLDYARDVTSDITALHISTTPAHTESLKYDWEKLGIDIPLTIVPTPYRDMLTTLEKYVSEREKKLKEGEILTVMLTKCVGHSWRDEIFHNQTAFFIESRLGHHKNTVSVLVPYQYDI